MCLQPSLPFPSVSPQARSALSWATVNANPLTLLFSLIHSATKAVFSKLSSDRGLSIFKNFYNDVSGEDQKKGV